MKKILFVLNYRESSGGISGQVELLRKYLNINEFKVEIFSTKGKLLKKIFCSLKLLTYANKFDLIHSHGCSGTGFLPIMIGTAAAKIHKKKVVITYYGGCIDLFLKRWFPLVRLFINQADCITAASKYLKGIFGKYGFMAEQVRELIDLAPYCFRERSQIRPNLLWIRSFDERTYNPLMLIRSFAIIKMRIPQASLTIVGTGQAERKIKYLIRHLKLKDIKLLKLLPFEELVLQYDKADIFLNTSNFDNQPVTILEAFASGLIVVSTDVGGINEMVQEKKTGFLVPRNDSRAMAEKVIWILKNRHSMAEIGINAREEVLKYTWSKIGPKWTKIYKSDKKEY